MSSKLSVKGVRWKLPKASITAEEVKPYAAHALPDEAVQLLRSRGVSPEQTAAFLSPKMRNELPPLGTFKDLIPGVKHVAAEIQRGGKLGVWSDYDCDGISSAALMRLYFRMIGYGEIEIRIPDRIVDGYGPNTPGLLKMKEDGIDTVMILDSGIVAFEPLKAAKDADLDVVVIDHHIAKDEIPEAVAVVNPNRKDNEPGFGHLCAGGMSFIFLVGLSVELRNLGYFDGKDGRPSAIPDLMQLLDIVAIATIVDVMVLKTINRAFVARGTEIMSSEHCRPGVRALIKAAGIRDIHNITALDVAWVLGPRLNSAGRISDAMLAVDLLTCEDYERALVMAEDLNKLNADRKALEKASTDQALAQFEARLGQDVREIAIATVEAHEGVVGISAARLKDNLGCPAIVLTKDHNGNLKGSARSVDGFDIGHAIVLAVEQGVILRGGGHGKAGGVTLAPEQLPGFIDFMNAEIRKSDYFVDGVQQNIDLILNPVQLYPELVDEISRLAPFGNGNENPVVVVPGVRATGYRTMKGVHQALALKEGRRKIEFVSWNTVGEPLGDLLENSANRPVDICGTLSINEFRGERSVQIMVEDVRLSEEDEPGLGL